MLMALGGFISLADRRYRVAAGNRTPEIKPEIKAVPAE